MTNASIYSRALAVIMVLGLAGLASAAPHGGTYRGPGTTVGPGGATAGGPSSTGAGAKSADSAIWSLWWSFNRDRYMELKASVHRNGPTSGGPEMPLGDGEVPQGPADLRPEESVIREIVVPAIRRALEKADDPDLITGSLLALAKIGDEPGSTGEGGIESILTPFIRHSNQEIRETAALALGVLANTGAAPLLAELVLDSDQGRKAAKTSRVPHRTRAFAAYGLGLIGNRSPREDVKRYVVHHLVQAYMLGRDEGTPELSVACVLSIGLCQLENGDLPDPESSLRPSSSRQSQIRFLITEFEDKKLDRRIRTQIPVALARLEAGASPSFKDELTALLTAPLAQRTREKSLIQHGATHALGLLGDDDDDGADVRIRRALEGAVEYGDRLSRHLALLSLGRVAGRVGGDSTGLGRAQTRTFLLKRMSSGGTSMRPWAGLALGLLERGRIRQGEQASSSVVMALRDRVNRVKSPDELGAYCIALGLVGDIESAGEIAEKTSKLDENLRGHAATALGLMGARHTMDNLRQGVFAKTTSYRPGVLRELSIALAMLGDKRIALELVVRINSTKNMLEQASIAATLGYVGDRRTVEPLVKVLESKRLSETTRAFACVALGMICDKEPYPWNAKFAESVSWWEAPPTLYDPVLGKGLLDIL